MGNHIIIKTSLNIEKEAWELFKQLTKQNNSDATKEMRKMINNYNKKYCLNKKDK